MDEWKDISHEIFRNYILDISGTEVNKLYQIDKPKLLKVRDSGSHMIIDSSGYTHYIKEYLAIVWKHNKSSGGVYNEF